MHLWICFFLWFKRTQKYWNTLAWACKNKQKIHCKKQFQLLAAKNYLISLYFKCLASTYFFIWSINCTNECCRGWLGGGLEAQISLRLEGMKKELIGTKKNFQNPHRPNPYSLREAAKIVGIFVFFFLLVIKRKRILTIFFFPNLWTRIALFKKKCNTPVKILTYKL